MRGHDPCRYCPSIDRQPSGLWPDHPTICPAAQIGYQLLGID
jgi:hypothetical protein